jgi:hypothetical protein
VDAGFVAMPELPGVKEVIDLIIGGGQQKGNICSRRDIGSGGPTIGAIYVSLLANYSTLRG